MYKVEAEEADYKITAEFEYLEDATRFCTKNKLELTLIYGHTSDIVEIWRKGKRVGFRSYGQIADKTTRRDGGGHSDLVRDVDIDQPF